MKFKFKSYKNDTIWVLKFLYLTFVPHVSFYNLDLIFEFIFALKSIQLQSNWDTK